MQVKTTQTAKKYRLILTAMMAFTVLPLGVSIRDTQAYIKNNKSRESHQKNTRFDVLKTIRSEDDNSKIYLSFVSVDKKLLEKNNINSLIELLNRTFKKRKRIKVYLFDNKKIAENFAAGKINPKDLNFFIRGIYFLDSNGKQEYLKYSSEKSKPWNEITIDIHNLSNS